MHFTKAIKFQMVLWRVDAGVRSLRPANAGDVVRLHV